MINLLKKHKYKLFTLILSIVSIFTLFLGINKTYAYETNQFSYTIDYDNISLIDTNFNFTLTKQNNQIIVDNNENHQLRLECPLLNTSNSNYSLLINYNVQYSTNGVDYYDLTDSNYFVINVNEWTSNYGYITASQRMNANMRNDGYFTIVSSASPQYNRSFNDIALVFSTFNNNIIFSSYYRLIIYNVDYVPFNEIALGYYYDTYYGQLEENYNTLQSNYNTLQNNYDTLEVNYGDLQDDYEELETNYNTLQDNYNNLEDKTSYGIFGYLQDANFQYDIQNTPQITINNKNNFDLTDLQQLGIISSGGNYNAYYFETNYNPNYYGVIGNFYFNSSLPLTLIDLTFKDMDGALVEIIDHEGGSARFNITSSLQTINYNNILELSSSFSNFVDEIHIKPNNADLMGSMFTSSSYNVGYLYGTQIGFKNGRDSLQGTVDSLNNRVNELEQQNEYQYNSGYQNGLNVGASQNLETNGMKTLFNSILSYPVNMIKSVFDFEFMGINISSLIMFIISIGIVAFVIKKFL